ncbi:hypothetical protein PHET_00385, partial [Paragonimus heterotremus]
AVTYASSFALVVLSVDRAEAVCRPLRVASSGLSSKTRARLLIGAAWVAAALFGLPGPLLAHKDYEGTEREACLLNFTKISPQVYLTSIAVSVFVLPACIIATCHVIMVATIWRASKLQTATFDGCPSHPVTLTRQTSNDVHLVQLEVTRKPRLAMPRYNRHKRSSTEGFLQKPKQPTHQNAGCIPRAKVKTVKMTCVIVSGKQTKFNNLCLLHVFGSELIDYANLCIFATMANLFLLEIHSYVALYERISHIPTHFEPAPFQGFFR